MTNILKQCVGPFVAAAVVLSLHASAFGQTMSDAAAAQVQALLAEKSGRTPAQRKLDSKSHYAAKWAGGKGVADGMGPAFSAGPLEQADGLVHVEIRAYVTANLLEAITALGGKVESSHAQYNSARAWLPLLAAEQL